MKNVNCSPLYIGKKGKEIIILLYHRTFHLSFKADKNRKQYLSTQCSQNPDQCVKFDNFDHLLYIIYSKTYFRVQFCCHPDKK